MASAEPGIADTLAVKSVERIPGAFAKRLLLDKAGAAL
jgi:hypothetical protein